MCILVSDLNKKPCHIASTCECPTIEMSDDITRVTIKIVAMSLSNLLKCGTKSLEASFDLPTRLLLGNTQACVQRLPTIWGSVVWKRWKPTSSSHQVISADFHLRYWWCMSALQLEQIGGGRCISVKREAGLLASYLLYSAHLRLPNPRF